MTIQRQYLLPNCTLTLEGLSSSTAVGAQNLRPSLDTLMRFECHFAKLDQTLVGGLDFLESLIQATSECTQSWMSGVQHVKAKRQQFQSDHVQLQPSDDGHFQMSVPSALLSGASSSADEPVDVRLTTVQLFDLAEALDQLLADAQTLPNLSSNIRPLSRREALSGQSVTKRSAPLALGTVGFAIAATALYFIPAPVVPRPKDEPVPVTTPVTPGTESPAPGATTEPPSDTNTAPGASPDTTATPEPAETPTPEDTP